MENSGPSRNMVTILDVLEVDILRRSILDNVHIRDLVRSERVSRRWQHIMILDYLQKCRTLTLDTNSRKNFLPFQPDYRLIQLRHDWHLPLLFNIVEKFGSSIITLSTHRHEEEFYESIACHCPHLKHLELKHISMRCGLEGKLGELFRDRQLEEIKVVKCEGLTGKILCSIKSNSLKSLSFTACSSLDYLNFFYAARTGYLRDVTNLELNLNRKAFLEKLHLVLENMPRLENLSLSDYYMTIWIGHAAFAEGISQLDNLRRLDVSNNRIVNDGFLEALARGCKHLEYLNIANSMHLSPARGLAALILRPSVVASLSLGYVRDLSTEILESIYLPLFTKMEAYGCRRVTPEMFREAHRISRQQKMPIELRLGRYTTPIVGLPELKIILIAARAPSTCVVFNMKLNPSTNELEYEEVRPKLVFRIDETEFRL